MDANTLALRQTLIAHNIDALTAGDGLAFDRLVDVWDAVDQLHAGRPLKEILAPAMGSGSA